MKSLLIEQETHKALKDYCRERNLKIKGEVDSLILEGMKIQRIKEAKREGY